MGRFSELGEALEDLRGRDDDVKAQQFGSGEEAEMDKVLQAVDKLEDAVEELHSRLEAVEIEEKDRNIGKEEKGDSMDDCTAPNA